MNIEQRDQIQSSIGHIVEESKACIKLSSGPELYIIQERVRDILEKSRAVLLELEYVEVKNEMKTEDELMQLLREHPGKTIEEFQDMGHFGLMGPLLLLIQKRRVRFEPAGEIPIFARWYLDSSAS